MVKIGEIEKAQSNTNYPPFAPVSRKQTKGGTHFETQFGVMLEAEIIKKREKTAS